MRLTIVAEFDPAVLDWQGKQPVDMIAAYNDFYSAHPWEAFEIALKDDRFKVVSAVLDD